MNEPPTIVVGASAETLAPPGSRPGAVPVVTVAVLVLAALWASGNVAPQAKGLVPVTVRLVGSNSVEVEPRLYEVSTTGVSEAALPDLRKARFDRSGQLLAGIAPSEATRGGVLSVGPPEGPFEQLGDGVRAFAWHDRRPELLAYVSPWGPVGAISVWEEGASTRERAIEGGLMHRFGDWGYAVTRPGPVRTADLYDSTGRFTGQVSGYAAGTGPGKYLVFTPRAPVPSLERAGVEAFGYTTEGERFDVPWLQAGELPYAIEAAPDRRRYAVHLGGEYETGLGEVLITRIDGSVEATISRTATPPASAWSPDGRYFVVARRDLAGLLEIGFYDRETQTLATAPVPEIPSSVVVWDIAVPNTN